MVAIFISHFCNVYKIICKDINISFQTMSFTKQILSLTANNKAERKLIAAVHCVLEENERTLKSITLGLQLDIEPDDNNRIDGIKQCYNNVIKVMLEDGIMNWGRMVVIIALAVYLQREFSTDLGDETSPYIEEFLNDWLSSHRPLKRVTDVYETLKKFLFLLF